MRNWLISESTLKYEIYDLVFHDKLQFKMESETSKNVRAGIKEGEIYEIAPFRNRTMQRIEWLRIS